MDRSQHGKRPWRDVAQWINPSDQRRFRKVRLSLSNVCALATAAELGSLRPVRPLVSHYLWPRSGVNVVARNLLAKLRLDRACVAARPAEIWLCHSSDGAPRHICPRKRVLLFAAAEGDEEMRRFSWALLLVALIPGLVRAQRGEPQLAAEVLRRMDANQDGRLEPQEISGRARAGVMRLADEAGLDLNQPLSINRLERQLRRQGGDESRRRGGPDDSRQGRGSQRRDAPSPEPARAAASTSGFGPVATASSVRGFGGSATATTSPPNQPIDDRTQRYVERFMTQYDRNQNGRLESSEWEGARWGSDPKESDLNKDGILTKEELAARMSNRWGTRSSAPDRSARPESDSGRERRSFERGPSGPGNEQSRGSGSSNSGSNDSNDRIRRYAEGLLKRYDRSGNGALEKDEWSQMRERYGSADANKDSVITVNELALFLSNDNRASGSSRSSSRLEAEAAVAMGPTADLRGGHRVGHLSLRKRRVIAF